MPFTRRQILAAAASLAVLVPVALIVLIILSLGFALLDLGHKLTG